MVSRIVVVEDETELLYLLHDVLEEEGFEVIALSRPDLSTMLDANLKPDLFLIDLMLPGISGVELAQQLRERGFAATPMIAMSASDLMIRLATESRLFQASVSKPFELSALLDCVKRYALF
jgi:CheY-like chemotaxis protein